MSSSRPKTVQIYLPDGNARSVRVAEITSRTVQATGEYTEDGLVVRSGSKACLEVVPSITDSIERKRENLQEVFLSEEGVLEKRMERCSSDRTMRLASRARRRERCWAAPATDGATGPTGKGALSTRLSVADQPAGPCAEGFGSGRSHHLRPNKSEALA